ncbi:MAG TPA: hypothetical protein VN326_10790 [Casimicrobiaceae bacterium]|jgi:hypothetical protein|nr:hypothetical protein [Casimicrobiaceae bacterium]
MSRLNLSLSKYLVVASALAFCASGLALADDSSISPFTRDPHADFHDGQNPGDFNAARAGRVQAANASAGRTKKKDELTPEQKIKLARAELTITLLRLFSDSRTGQ